MKKFSIQFMLLAFFLLFNHQLSAQKLTVESMRHMPDDMTAMLFENQRQDLNDDYAGIVKVMLAVNGAKFDGSGMLEQRLYESGEYWVWMAKGSKRIKVHAPGYLPLDVNFFDDYGIKVESKHTYSMIISTPTGYIPPTLVESNVPIIMPSYVADLTANQMNELGEDYYYGRNGKSQDLSEAVKWIRKSAELGDAQGQYNLGTMLAQGLIVQQDYSEAVKWLQKSAEQGYDQAQYNLGVMYAQGLGLPRDFTEAVKWFQRSADQEYARGQYNLGVMYYNGLGVRQNYTEALKWYRKSAEQGDSLGQCNVGYMYEYGIGVEQNYSEALKWFRMAAEQGCSFGQFDLGVMYFNGYGVPQNYAEAVKWFRKAAEQNNVEAQHMLGMIFENGVGVLKDNSQAIKWYEKAAAQGHEDAKNALKRLNGN